MLAVIEQVFEALMEGYLEKVPYARQAIKIIQGKNDSFVNDHVAFRWNAKSWHCVIGKTFHSPGIH